MSIINEALKKAQAKNEQIKKQEIKPAEPEQEKIDIVPSVEPDKPEQGNKRAGIVFLIIILVIVSVFLKINDAKKTDSGKGSEKVITETISTKDPGIKIFKKEPQPNIGITVYSPNDPKQSLVSSSFELSGIIYGTGSGDYAIVNDKVLEIGDRIDDYKLITIEKDNIVLFDGKEEVVLDLK